MLNSLMNAPRRVLRDCGGNVAIMAAIALPILLGAFGLGAEAASWMAIHRGLQDAADAAAIAAATNASSTYDVEARAVAAQYGFTDGQNGATVSASNAVACPPGAAPSPCYSVTVSYTTPLLLAQIVGYQGDATLGGAPAKLIRATAIAVQGVSNRPYCILALGTSGVNTAFTSDGGPKADLSGCNIMSNTDATCNGHNLQADVGDAHGSNNGCGVTQHSNVPALSDPFAALASNIPADPCGGTYPQEPAKKSGPALPASNRVSGTQNWSNVTTVCGDLQLVGNVTISQNTTLVIYNGQLDTNGYTLQSAAGVGATVVFAGSNGAYTHAPTGGGTLDIAAPTSGPWAGMALYQAPNLTMGVDISAAGNSPTWDITGNTYFPNANVTFSGAVNKSSNGSSCFGMVVNSLLINGTASILAHGQCGQAGVTLPTGQVPGRGRLVR